MDYLVAIKTAIFIFPIVAFLITVPFMLGQYHKYGAIHWLRVLIIYSFILYLINAYFLTILPLPSISEVEKSTGPIFNLVPFSFVIDFIKESSLVITNPNTYLKAISEPCFYVVIFNVFLTIPFGMYLRYYYKCSFKKTVLLTFLLSLFFEITQVTGLYFIYPRPYRLFDVDDLILNTLGGILGYFIAGFFNKVLPSRNEIDEQAIKKGEKVSGIRRITLFFFDLFLVTVVIVFVSLFVNYDYISLIILVIYYVVVPSLWQGKTLGGSFLNVKITFNKHPFLGYLVRFLFIGVFYFGSVILLLIFLLALESLSDMAIVFAFFLFIAFFASVFILHAINIIRLVFGGRAIYDGLIKANYESTIRKNKEENQTPE